MIFVIYVKLATNEKLAEMVGIFQGSGIINDNHLVISIDKNRKKFIDHVFQLIETVIELKPRKEQNVSKTRLIINNPEAVPAFESSWKANGTANCFFLYV